MILTIIVAVIIFCLIYWLIGLIPLPPPLAQARWVLYALLVIGAIIFLLNLAGIHLP
jgi:hypothetical protein